MRQAEPQGRKGVGWKGNFPQRKAGLDTGSGTTGSSSGPERRVRGRACMAGASSASMLDRLSISRLLPQDLDGSIAHARNGWAVAV